MCRRFLAEPSLYQYVREARTPTEFKNQHLGVRKPRLSHLHSSERIYIQVRKPINCTGRLIPQYRAPAKIRLSLNLICKYVKVDLFLFTIHLQSPPPHHHQFFPLLLTDRIVHVEWTRAGAKGCKSIGLYR